MIVGVGTDIVQIVRIEKILAKYGENFINRILADKEIEKLQQLHSKASASFIAKRFAGKEAISKAFGTGIAGKLQFKDITILNDQLGKPFVDVTSLKPPQDEFKIHLSLADDYPIAVAFAVVSL